MNPCPPEDAYLLATIHRHRALPIHPPNIKPLLRGWMYFNYLESITLSGSHAKGTALRNSDLDFLLQLSPSAPGTLAAIHASLADHMRDHLPLTRNVSVRIRLDGASIDLVPARANILWQARFNTWIKTNVEEQIRYVRASGLTNEILWLKLWIKENGLRFPSFLAELATIRALKPGDPIASSITGLLNYLATDFPTARILDPANSNNVVSDVLMPWEKSRIALTAQMTDLWGRL